MKKKKKPTTAVVLYSGPLLQTSLTLYLELFITNKNIAPLGARG